MCTFNAISSHTDHFVSHLGRLNEQFGTHKKLSWGAR